MSTYDRPDKPKYGGIAVNVVDDDRPISGAFVSLYKAPDGVAKCSDFEPARWQPKPSRHIVTLQTATSDDETEDKGRCRSRDSNPTCMSSCASTCLSSSRGASR